MRILLLGATGRLGSEIRKVCDERNWNVTPVSREMLANHGLFQTCLGVGRCTLLDVSLPEGTASLCRALVSCSPAVLTRVECLVVGSTGHADHDIESIRLIAKKIPVSLVSNFSRGVFLLEELLKATTTQGTSVASLARNLGFDLALWESHHALKRDAPSGTAVTLAAAAGIEPGKIASTRVGSVVGEHAVFASGDSEELRFWHIAHTRRLFALGALDLVEKMAAAELKPGLYDKAFFWGK